MTWREHRSWSIMWFCITLVITSIFYIYLLRQFGALPEVRRNADRLSHLEAAIDSMRTEIRREQP